MKALASYLSLSTFRELTKDIDGEAVIEVVDYNYDGGEVHILIRPTDESGTYLDIRVTYEPGIPQDPPRWFNKNHILLDPQP